MRVLYCYHCNINFLRKHFVIQCDNRFVAMWWDPTTICTSPVAIHSNASFVYRMTCLCGPKVSPILQKSFLWLSHKFLISLSIGCHLKFSFNRQWFHLGYLWPPDKPVKPLNCAAEKLLNVVSSYNRNSNGQSRNNTPWLSR